MEVSKELTLTITDAGSGLRLDKFLGNADVVPSRSFAEKIIADGLVTVNGLAVRRSYKLNQGDQIRVIVPTPQQIEVQAEAIPLDIQYEDGDLLVINKPRGMVVHPGAGHNRETLVNALLHHCDDLSGIGGKLRPGIVHRLDKDTTGLMLAAKNDFTHLALSHALKNREINRWYLALAKNSPKAAEGQIEAPIGRHRSQRQKMSVTQEGRPAVTHYRMLQAKAGHCLLQLKLKTGRTHQIRVHLAYIGVPVIGDSVYGSTAELGLGGQALHSFRLRFKHPRNGKTFDFHTAPPPDFIKALESLGMKADDFEELAIDNWGLDW